MLTKGQVLNQRYVVVEKLGWGSSSEIYLVNDPQSVSSVSSDSGTDFALVVKVLSPATWCGRSKYADLERFFYREAEILQDLSQQRLIMAEQMAEHQGWGNLLQVPLDTPSQNLFKYRHQDLQGMSDLPCLVMEYVPGMTLEAWFEQEQFLSWDKFVDWFEQLVAGLAVLHQRGYVHRDIKPANIMLRPDGQLVIIDYGAARSISNPTEPERPDHATAIGTFDFMCEEQRSGQLHLNFDLYGLGWCFIMLLTRELPINWRCYRRNEDGTPAVSWYDTLSQALDNARNPDPDRSDEQANLDESVYQKSLAYLDWLRRFVGMPDQRPDSAVTVWAEIQPEILIKLTDQPIASNGLVSPEPLGSTGFSLRQRMLAAIPKPHWRKWSMVAGGAIVTMASLWMVGQVWSDQLTKEAIILRRQRDHQLSDAKLSAALLLNPYNAEALNIMGMNTEDLGNPSAALRLFQRSLWADPKHIWTYNNLGRRYILDHDFDGAYSVLMTGLALAKDLPSSSEKSEITSFLTKNLIWLLLSRGETQRALPLLEQEFSTNEMTQWQAYPISKCFKAELADQQRLITSEARLTLWRDCQAVIQDWLQKEPHNEEPQKWAETVAKKISPLVAHDDHPMQKF